MKINVSQMGSVTVISPQGALAQDDVEEFVRVLATHLQRTKGRLIIDMEGVSFLDSNGVEAIWDFADRLHEAGHTTKLASVPELCREILELTSVSDHLDIYDTCESAVRSFV